MIQGSETISHGPKFKGFSSFIGGFISLFIVPIELYMIITLLNEFDLELFVGSIVVLPFPACSIALFLGFEGVQINYDLRTIRKYKKLLWFRRGKWFDLNEFSMVVLVKDRFSYSVKEPHGYRKITRNSFDVCLADDLNKNRIILNEFIEYQDSKRSLEKYSKTLNLPYINEVENK